LFDTTHWSIPIISTDGPPDEKAYQHNTWCKLTIIIDSPQIAAICCVKLERAASAHPHREDHGPFLFQLKGTPAEYKAGLERAIAKGWLWPHESGSPKRAPRYLPDGLPQCRDELIFANII
jgi:hypothetical protein